MPELELHFKQQTFFFDPDKDSFAFSYPATQPTMQNIDYEKLVTSLILPKYRFGRKYQIFVHFPRALDATKLPIFLERQSAFQMRSDLADFLIGLQYADFAPHSSNHDESLLLVHSCGSYSAGKVSNTLNRLPAQSEAARMSIDPDSLSSFLERSLDNPRWIVPVHHSPPLVVGSGVPTSQFWVVNDNLSTRSFKLSSATVDRILGDEAKGFLSSKRVGSGGLCFIRIRPRREHPGKKYLFRQSYPLKSYYSIEAHCHQLARAWKNYKKIRLRFCSEQLLLPFWVIRMLERICEQHEIDVIIDSSDFALAKPELISLTQFLLDTAHLAPPSGVNEEVQIWVGLDHHPSLLTCEKVIEGGQQ